MLQRSKGRVIIRAVFLLVEIIGLFIGGVALFHPDGPLPNQWSPLRPLSVTDPVTPLTNWKLRRAVANRGECLAVLAAAGQVTPLNTTQTRRPQCVVQNPVGLDRIGNSTIKLRETDCATALRLAMWEHHGLQPAAQDILGTNITRIVDNGSYNCRQMRTTAGTSTRWSTHATAMAIDVSGFDLADGRKLRLIDDWTGDPAAAAFLRSARDTACTWFRTTLSPDYNRLHADHFHLQAVGWGTCR